ncbi:MAG TPA: kinase/pyrophosphorylase, partial [Oxalicibacterium sp.]|nr:kinase/pyrophosphorylase [Oxalicibacterium sp.]
MSTPADPVIKPLPMRTAFFVSDGTGITAETFAHSVLSQFDMPFRQIRLPFIDSIDKAHLTLRRINETCAIDGQRPIVFSTLVKTELSDIVRTSQGLY